MPFIDYFLFFGLGLLSGLLAGLLGIGGGIIIVPSLYFLFHFLDFKPDLLMQLAIGTSLATMVITTSVSAWVYYKRGSILWKYVFSLFPGVLVGVLLGVITAHYLHSRYLAIIFGVFAVLLGIYFLLFKNPHFHFGKPLRVKLGGFGSLVGYLSSLLGIGGGTAVVPILIGFSIPMKNAAAISSIVTFFVALVGSISYLIIGLPLSHVHDSFGYIFLPAFVMVSIGTLVSVSFGVRLAHILHTDILKRIFSLVLIATGLAMLFH